MKAAAFEALGKPLRIDTIPDPTPQDDEVVVAVNHCGICGSDIHMALEPEAFGLTDGFVMGHEFSGEIMATGSEVNHLKIGQRVSVVPFRSCGRCASCLAGNPAWCSQMQLIGGGYGEYASVKARQCVPLPTDASFADGALLEPLAVALHGINRAQLRPGDRVLVLGAGPIGLAVAFWAARLGARRVVVQDIKEHQRERALEMGATGFICCRDEPPWQDTEKLLGGKADIVFECAGVPGMIARSVDVLRTQGTLLMLGLCTYPDTFVPFEVLSKELCIQTSAFFDQTEYETALDVLASGILEPRLLITDKVALEELPPMFEQLKSSHQHCKVMIHHAH